MYQAVLWVGSTTAVQMASFLKTPWCKDELSFTLSMWFNPKMFLENEIDQDKIVASADQKWTAQTNSCIYTVGTFPRDQEPL